MQATAATTEYRNRAILHFKTDCVVSLDDGSQECDVINLYPDRLNQTVLGFGGAVTEAAGDTLLRLPQEKRQELLRDCFGGEGLCYTLARTSIDSCDFSLSQYEAAPYAGAPFRIARDEASILPVLREAQAFCPEPISLMLTPWSPPAYMKDNGERSHGGKLKAEYYGAWADYICRYVAEYRARGVRVDRLSIQNEPNAVQRWDSCLFSGAEEKRFLRDFLAPSLRKNGLNDVAVYIWDHNKERLFDRVCEVVDEETLPLIAGAAFHWYSGDHFDALRLVRREYPKLELLFSEGCIEYGRFAAENQLQSARIYGRDLIGNFNAGMNTFIDWNLALNESGGPNHAENYCDAPILCDTRAGTYEKRLSYYYIWHFSHFIKTGARHVSSTRFGGEVNAAAFQNPDGAIVVVLLNTTPAQRKVFLRLNGSVVEAALPPDAIGTVTIRE